MIQGHLPSACLNDSNINTKYHNNTIQVTKLEYTTAGVYCCQSSAVFHLLYFCGPCWWNEELFNLNWFLKTNFKSFEQKCLLKALKIGF